MRHILFYTFCVPFIWSNHGWSTSFRDFEPQCLDAARWYLVTGITYLYFRIIYFYMKTRNIYGPQRAALIRMQIATFKIYLI